MGRTISNPVQRMFFVYDGPSNTSLCSILGCPRPLRRGRNAGNLENHVKVFHPNEFKKLLIEKLKVPFCQNEYEDEPSSSILKVSNY